MFKPLPWITALVAVCLICPDALAKADPAPVVDQFLKAYERARNFRGVVRVTERKGRETATLRFQLVLEKPNRTAITILESPQARHTEGARLVWFGGKTLEVKAMILGIPIRVTTGVEDDRLRDFRGYSNADLTIGRSIQVLNDPRTEVDLIEPGELEPDDRALKWVSLRSPALLPGIAVERIGLDSRDHLPRVREMVAGGTCVYRLVVEKGEFDIELPPTTFDLSR